MESPRTGTLSLEIRSKQFYRRLEGLLEAVETGRGDGAWIRLLHSSMARSFGDLLHVREGKVFVDHGAPPRVPGAFRCRALGSYAGGSRAIRTGGGRHHLGGRAETAPVRVLGPPEASRSQCVNMPGTTGCSRAARSGARDCAGGPRTPVPLSLEREGAAGARAEAEWPFEQGAATISARGIRPCLTTRRQRFAARRRSGGRQGDESRSLRGAPAPP